MSVEKVCDEIRHCVITWITCSCCLVHSPLLRWLLGFRRAQYADNYFYLNVNLCTQPSVLIYEHLFIIIIIIIILFQF